MHYALLIYTAPEAAYVPDETRADDGVFDSWVAYTQALKDAGLVSGGEALEPVETATTVRLRLGERLLTDGPFIETKEHLLGFYVIDAPDLDTAIDWAARMPHIRHGTVEIRPLKRGMAWQDVLLS